MDKEQTILSLKYVLVAHIDGNWGAGDVHLFSLRLLQTLDPQDEKISNLLGRLEKAKEQLTNPQSVANRKRIAEEYHVSEEACLNESIYRDAGQEEAEAYKEQIIQKYGQEYFDKLDEFYWAI